MKIGDMSALGSDLEEGEIADEAFEDISECSLSEILTLQEDLKDDSDLDHLREEALKSLQEKDDVTEEELYRFEALQSLLMNIEAKEKKSKKRKRKKKSKEKPKPENLKRKKLKEEVETVSDSSMWSENSCACIRNKENHIERDSNLETRSWYPKSDFALLGLQRIDTSNNKSNTEDFIPVTKVLSPTKKKVNYFKNVAPKVPPISVPKTVTVVTPLPRPTQYATISKHHIRKFNNALPTVKGFVPPIRNGKYKLVNTTKYALKKTNLKIDKTFKPKNLDKSKYSINRVASKFPRLDPNDFVIELDEDSGNEECDGSNVSETAQSARIHIEEKCNCSPALAEKLKNAVNIAKTAQQERKLHKCDSSVNVCDGSSSDAICSRSVSVSTAGTTLTVQPSNAVGIRNGLISTVDAADADQSSDIVGARSVSVFATDTVDSDRLRDAVEIESMSVSTAATVDMDQLSDTVSIGSWSVSTMDTVDVDQLIDAMGSRSVSVSTMETIDTDRSNSTVGSRSVSVSTVERIDTDRPIDTSGSRSVSVSIVETVDTDQSPSTFRPRSVSVSTVETVDTEQGQGKETPVQSPTSSSIDTNRVTEKKVKKTATAVRTPVSCRGKRKSVLAEKQKCPRYNEDVETEKVNKENTKLKVNETLGNDIKTSANNVFVLTEAEKCLVEIRAKLLSNLKDMEQRITRHDHEVNKLNDMMKNLLTLKSMTIKLEEKIRLQKSRLAMSKGSLQSLFKSITVRSQTCSQYKNVCIRAGMEVVGPQYNPPTDYELLVGEKIKTIDFSKYGPSNMR